METTYSEKLADLKVAMLNDIKEEIANCGKTFRGYPGVRFPKEFRFLTNDLFLMKDDLWVSAAGDLEMRFPQHFSEHSLWDIAVVADHIKFIVDNADYED